jgi:phage/plasmid-associated DNA primase
MDTWKPLVTADEIGINRKHKTHLTMSLHVTVEMQSNESPVTDDQTDAVWRRMAVVPSSVSFTGCENRAIKAHHIYDKATLEWLLRHCLHEYDFEAKDLEEYITEEMKEELSAYQSEINPVCAFLDEYLSPDEDGDIKGDIVIATGQRYSGGWCKDPDNSGKAVRCWGMYPLKYLYAAYCDYAREAGHMRMKKQSFKDNLLRWASHSAYWRWTDDTVWVKESYRMCVPDSLAAEFGDRGEELSKLLSGNSSMSPYSRLLYMPSTTYRGALLMRDEVASGKVVGMPQKKKDTGANTGANEGADIGAVMALLEQMTPEAKAALIAKLLAGQTTITG